MNNNFVSITGLELIPAIAPVFSKDKSEFLQRRFEVDKYGFEEQGQSQPAPVIKVDLSDFGFNRAILAVVKY